MQRNGCQAGLLKEGGATPCALSERRKAEDEPESEGVAPENSQVVGKLVRLAGFEPATCCSGGNRSIHLSYRRTLLILHNLLE